MSVNTFRDDNIMSGKVETLIMSVRVAGPQYMERGVYWLPARVPVLYLDPLELPRVPRDSRIRSRWSHQV